MERTWIGKLCFSFHPDTGAHDEHVIAVREELSLHFAFFFSPLTSLTECGHPGDFTCYCLSRLLISCVTKTRISREKILQRRHPQEFYVNLGGTVIFQGMLIVLAPSTMKISSIVVPQTLSKLLYLYFVFSLHCWTVLPSLDTLSPCSSVKKKKEKRKLGRAEKAQTYDEFMS